MAMRTSHLLALLILPALVLVGGTLNPDAVARADAPPAAPPPAAVEQLAGLAALVPADSEMLVYVPSFDALLGKATSLVEQIDPSLVEDLDAEMILGQIAGPLVDLLDLKKPMAIAATVSMEEGPAPVFVLPVTDVAEATKRFVDGGMPAPKTSDGYVLMMMGPGEPKAGGSPLVKDIPAGDIVVRLDLATLIEKNREAVDAGLAEMKKGMESGAGMPIPVPGMDKMIEGMMKGVEDFVASAEAFDLTASISGSNVHLKGFFTAKEGSPLASLPVTTSTTGLAPIAASLPSDWPLTVLFSMNFADAMKTLEPFMDTVYEMYPENMRAPMRKLMDAYMPLYKMMGDQHAFALDMGEQGMAMVGVSAAKDPQAVIAEYKRILKEEGAEFAKTMGVQWKFGQQAVLGHEVHTMHLAFDWEKMTKAMGQDEQIPPEATEQIDEMVSKMFGPDGLVFHLIPAKDRLYWTMGGNAVLEQAIQTIKGEIAPISGGGLAQAIQTAGGAPTFLFHMEGRRVMKGGMDFVKMVMPSEMSADMPMPEIPDGDPIPLVIYGGAQGRTFVGGMSVDVGGFAKLIMQLMGE